jgi:hypothetical protein
MLTTNSRIHQVILSVITICLLACTAAASEKLPATVSESLQKLHPDANVSATSIDEDGLFQIDLNVNENRFLVELTQSGRVVSNKEQGQIQASSEAALELSGNVLAAIKKLYPQGKVISAKADIDGVFQIRIETPRGVSHVEATRSGRILKHDRDASDQDEDLSISSSSAIQHIESVRKLPDTVLVAAEKAHPQGVIVHVYQDQFGPRYGRSAYYLSIVKGNQVHNVGLSATGEVLKNTVDNQTQRLERLPEEIKLAARTTFPTGIIYGAGERNHIYQVDILVNGKPYDLEITKTGQVVTNKPDHHE